MMTSILIVGGTESERKKAALEIATKNSSILDIKIIDAITEGGISNVRNLKQELSRKPYNSKVQTALILEAQNLTIEAQNALLKEVEEPNLQTQIILTAPAKFSLVSTLTSRCQKIDLISQGSAEISLETKQLAKEMAEVETGERIILGERIKFQEWFFLWHEFFHKKLKADYSQFPFLEKINLTKICNYLRFLQEVNKRTQGNLNKKLTQLILTLKAPF